MQSAQAIADKWARNAGSAGESYKAGINAVTESPTAKAAAASDRYLNGVQRAVAENKFQDGLLRVSLADWKRAALDKGASRLSTGVSAAKDKMQQFLAEFLPYLEAGKNSLPARGDFEQNLTRMMQQVRYNKAFRRRM